MDNQHKVIGHSCIGLKCSYCYEDEFKLSCYRCSLSNLAFPKDLHKEVGCPVVIFIDRSEEKLKDLKKLEKKTRRLEEE